MHTGLPLGLQQPEDQLRESLINFIQESLLATTVARKMRYRSKGIVVHNFWSCIGNQWVSCGQFASSSCTMRCALVLSHSLEQQRAARSFKEDFHFLLQMEERARGDDGLLEVLRFVVWRQDPIVHLRNKCSTTQGDTFE